MDEEELDDYDRDAEMELFREYRDISSQFRFVVETERRLYLANDVELGRIDTGNGFYFELNMNDVWVWDIYRANRFVKHVQVLSFKDVNIEELAPEELELPEGFNLEQDGVDESESPSRNRASRNEDD